MGMYALIEDAQQAALNAANCWHETPEAQALIARVDAFELQSDHWYCECPEAAKGFAEAAREAESELDDIRAAAIDAAAATYTTDRRSDEWHDAWDAAEEDAPPVSQVLAAGRRDHAGDAYLKRFAR